MAEQDQRSIFLKTSDDRDYGYWIICDINYTHICKDNTRCLQLLPLKRRIQKDDLVLIKGEKGCATAGKTNHRPKQ